MRNKRVAVLVIDPQNDFCLPTGSLSVPGAMDDMSRLSAMINKNEKGIELIGVTLDSHQVLDISHPGFWQDKNGNHPNPFTIITSKDVDEGIWTPLYWPMKAIEYIHSLEKQGEYPHCIWPEHCIIGSTGAAVVEVLHDAMKQWSRLGNFKLNYVMKGTHPLTEHFGAFKSQVPVEGDMSTQMNEKFIKTLMEYDVVLGAGQAKSHCVANTIKQGFEFPELMKKFVILEDCMSNVPGFEHIADPIYEKAKQMGVQFVKSTDIILV